MGSFSAGKGKGVVTEGELREEKEKGVLRATFVLPLPPIPLQLE
jgi:hypothetical protein